MQTNRYFCLRIGLAICWLIVTIFLLTLPGTALPTADWFDKIYFDKWVHVGMFATLVLLFYWALANHTNPITSKKTLFSIIIAAIIYGIAMEFVQKYWVAFRSCDIKDMLADGFGSILPLLFKKKIDKVCIRF